MKYHLLLIGLAFTFTSSILNASSRPHVDLSFQHQENVINIYGPGGPDTAFRSAAKAFSEKNGVKVNITSGPESTWSDNAKNNADIIFGSSELSMSAFVATYSSITSSDVQPIYLRRAVIIVPKGNPKNITGIADLIKKPSRIVVTEGLGTYNTSGTGLWEDIVGRTGSLSDIQNFRKNIISFSQGSGASFKAFQQENADAWITWIDWALTNTDKVDYVEIEPERRIYRDLNIVKTRDAIVQTQQFIDFINSEEGQYFFTREGWSR